jgi:hypothetical protein
VGKESHKRASLEAIVESGDLGLLFFTRVAWRVRENWRSCVASALGNECSMSRRGRESAPVI